MSPGRRRWRGRPVLGRTCRLTLLLTSLTTDSEYNQQHAVIQHAIRAAFTVRINVLLFLLIQLLLTSGCSSPVTLQWRHPPTTRRLLALFAFPQTVTLQGTIESRKVSHYRTVKLAVCVFRLTITVTTRALCAVELTPRPQSALVTASC